MRRLTETVAAYLDEIGQLQAPELGGNVRATRGKDELRRRLLQEQKFNRSIILLIVTLLTILYLSGIFLVLRNLGRPITAGTLLGGQLVSLLLIVRWIRQTLLDKIYADLLLRASDELEPDHLARFVTTWYELTTKAGPDRHQTSKGRGVRGPKAARQE